MIFSEVCSIAKASPYLQSKLPNRVLIDSYTVNGEQRIARNSGSKTAKGYEVLIRKDMEKQSNTFFGWLSYTFNDVTSISGLPLERDSYGNTLIFDRYDQKHTLKLVLGYHYKGHTFSSRIQYFTSTPYTPIVGDKGPADSKGRYIPVSGSRNSARFDPQLQVNLRYSRKLSYRWGYIKWYLELVNITNGDAITNEQWNYNRPYQSNVNPKPVKADEGLPIIPNFGVEARF